MNVNRNRPTGRSSRPSGNTWLTISLATAVVASAVAVALWSGNKNKPSEVRSPAAAAPSSAVRPQTQMRAPREISPARGFPDVKLSLTGITRQGEGATALISVDGRPAGAYGVGQELLDGITIRSILQNRVVLGYGPLSRTLLLGADRKADTVAEAAQETEKIVEGYKEMNPDIDPTLLSRNRIALAKDFLSEVKLARNPRGGFVVEQVEPRSMYGKLGLRPGDVVFSIDTPETAAVDESSMESVMSQTTIELEVLRDGNFVLLRHRLD